MVELRDYKSNRLDSSNELKNTQMKSDIVCAWLITQPVEYWKCFSCGPGKGFQKNLRLEGRHLKLICMLKGDQLYAYRETSRIE